MKREVISYVFAFAAAGLNTLSVFYINMFGPEVTKGGIVMTGDSYNFWIAALIFLFAEYIFFGRKDNMAKVAVRFIIHNIFSVTWAFSIYGIYTVSNMQEKYHWLPQTILQIVVPSAIRGFFICSVFSAVICVIVLIIRSVSKRKKLDRR